MIGSRGLQGEEGFRGAVVRFRSRTSPPMSVDDDRPGSRQSRRELRAAVEATHDALRYDDLDEEVLPRLTRVLGASHTMLFQFDQHGAPDAMAGSLVEHIGAYSQEMFVQDPLQRALMVKPPKRGAVHTEDGLDWPDFLSSSAYHEFYNPLGMQQLRGIWITDVPYGTPGMTGVLISRRLRDGPFPEFADDALATLLPALEALRRRHLRLDAEKTRRARVSSAIGDLLPWPCLLIDRRGEVHWSAPEVTLLKQRTGIPEARLHAMLAGHVARLLRRSPADRAPAPICLELGDVEDRVRLTISRCERYPELAIVAFMPKDAGPRQLAALASRHALTPAEQRILQSLAAGGSNRMIAQELHVSLDTVKTHVQRVLAKLGVSSRTQAAVRVLEGLHWGTGAEGDE